MKKLTRAQLGMARRIGRNGSVVLVNGGYATVGGQTLHKRVVRNLIDAGFLAPSGDTLFAGIEPQTLRANPEFEIEPLA